MILVALNGFTQRDMNKSVVGHTKDILRESGVKPTGFVCGMGGGGLAAFVKRAKKVEKLIKKNPGQRLVMIGHSYGGHWIRRLLWRLERRGVLHLTQPEILMVDPQYVLHRMARKSRRVPDSVKGTCYRQPYGMAGYAVSGGDVKNYTLHNTNHKDIVNHKQVVQAIRCLITS